MYTQIYTQERIKYNDVSAILIFTFYLTLAMNDERKYQRKQKIKAFKSS